MGASTGVLILELPCALTDAETLLRGNELARCQLELGKIEANKKANAADFKAQAEAIENRIARLARVVAEKEESRPVECRLEEDRNAATMKTVRVDTGEVVSSRPMTEAERQSRLFGGPTPAEAAEQLEIDKQVDEVFSDPVLCEACKQPEDLLLAHGEPYDEMREKDGVTVTSHAFQPPAVPGPVVDQAEAGSPADPPDEGQPSSDPATVEAVRAAAAGKGKRLH